MTEPTPYALEITSEARTDLSKIAKSQAKRIITKLQWLATNATVVQHTSLKGEWEGYYRWRIGD